jgi:hypothetical protein
LGLGQKTMTNTLFGFLLIIFGALICIRRRWVAGKLQRFYSNYPVTRPAPPEQLLARGGFVVILGLVVAGIGVFAIAERWIF